MGKRLKQQRRGKGSNAYSSPGHRFMGNVVFRKAVGEGRINGEVVELVDDPGHHAPLMRIKYDDYREFLLLAPEGIRIGDIIQEGKGAALKLGSILPIGQIPEGMPIYNIEAVPNDGGKYVRAPGGFATVVSQSGGKTSVLMPSKQTVELNSNCRAEIGAVAGGGSSSKPIMKAGKSYYMMHALNRTWPKNRGVKSNPVDHPFGGKQHHKGASSMVARGAPPGAKVGHIAARRVGRKKIG